MLKQIITTILGLSLLSGCADGVRGYFKKSANNKMIDNKGFEGGKRKPLYNKKYINTAKQNIIEDNYEDDDEDDGSDDNIYNERSNPSRLNRALYRKMIERDAERVKSQRLKDYSDKYSTLNEASKKVKDEVRDNSEDTANIRKELAQIKSMLNDSKKDLAKYNCASKSLITEKPLTQNQTSSNNSEVLTHKKTSEELKDTKKSLASPKTSAVKKKFLSEDEDIKDSIPKTKINNNQIDSQKVKVLLPRSI